MNQPRVHVGAAITVVVLATLFAGGLALWDGGAEVRPTTVVGLRPAEVRHLVVQSADRRIGLNRRDNDWRAVSGTPSQSATLMFSFEDRLLPLLAYRALDVDPMDPDFGLGEPEIRVAIRDARGAERHLLLGAPSFTGGGYYAGVIGRSRSAPTRRVYLVTRRAMDDFRSLLEGKIVDSSEFFEDKLGELEAKQTQAEQEADISPWLHQVLDEGGQLPPGVQ